MPLTPREMFPLVPAAEERVWLGPTENSFKIEGVMVLTRFAEKFQPGCFWVQPPGKVTAEAQAKMPNGPGNGVNGDVSFSELWIQRPYTRFLLFSWRSTRRMSSRRGASPERACE